MPTLYLIDGSSQMYRAYHAIRGLTGPDGRSTNAVYGFVAMLRKLLADHKPDAIGAAFDLEGRTFRDDRRNRGTPRRKTTPGVHNPSIISDYGHWRPQARALLP